MNVLQYLVLGIAAVAVIGTPFMLAKAIRRKQKGRVISVLRDLVLIYVISDIVFPAIPAPAPRPAQWFCLLMLLLFVLDFFSLIDRLLTHSRKGLLSERR